MAPHNFLKPFLPMGPVSAMQKSSVSPNSDDFISMSQSMVENELMLVENEKLSESTDSVVEDEPSFDQSDYNSKPRRVQFISSPQFLSPRRRKMDDSLIDLNLTDNGTPKAIIRDRFKRVSIALSDKEFELESERQARLDLEKEHQELQEFTRLESESDSVYGGDVSDSGNDKSMVDKLKWYEKSYKDSEELNRELGKVVTESKQEISELSTTI